MTNTGPNTVCKRVLVVEDDPAIRQTLRDTLEIHGYVVEAAADGKSGIEILKSIGHQPCVILLDLMMPVMNGWGFLDELKSHPTLRSIPVVICSAYEESAKSVHPAAFVPKPVQLDALLGAVKAFCA